MSESKKKLEESCDSSANIETFFTSVVPFIEVRCPFGAISAFDNETDVVSGSGRDNRGVVGSGQLHLRVGIRAEVGNQQRIGAVQKGFRHHQKALQGLRDIL